ncbi:MAG: 2-oxo acid dehydrogenase subunit E2 [Deltaproteobacteria bacterium]|nr:2-oxo acid dehydrogenase subunit E2 [Deltaproteobacteria bacterium]
MPYELKMPQMGISISEGTLVRWLKEPGERVARDEPLFEIETDKVATEITAPVGGVLTQILAEEGALVPVGTVIGTIATEGEAAPATPRATPAPAPAAQPPAPAAATVAPPAATPPAAAPSAGPAPATAPGRPGAPAEAGWISPVVMRLAREHGVDLGQIRGTGFEGRVTKKDVLDYVARQAAAPAAGPAPTPAPPTARPSVPAAEALEEIVPFTPMRRAIAEHMLRSVRTSPHVTGVTEVDMTRIARYREGVKEAFRQQEGASLTYVPFVIHAAVAALKAFPLFNASVVDDRIVLKKYYHIGVAVALDDGLIVPVIHDADRLDLAGLARAVADLATRARQKKLVPDEVKGATFTVNNLGAFGNVIGTPIINQPNVAILGIGSVVKRPVVTEDDAIAIRHMAFLCLSYDHRVIDGGLAGRFLQQIRLGLEQFPLS